MAAVRESWVGVRGVMETQEELMWLSLLFVAAVREAAEKRAKLN